MPLASRLARAVAALGFVLLLAGPPPAAAETYVFDKAHTNVSFSWNRLGISRQTGRVVDVDGRLEFDPESPEQASVDVTMRAASIWTGVDALDRHLRSPDFFDAARHPTITFRSTAVKRTGDRTAEVTGDLTILGKARPVTLTVHWNFTGEHPLSSVNPTYRDRVVSGFSARATVLRSEWGLSRATPLVADEVEIVIETELFRRAGSER